MEVKSSFKENRGRGAEKKISSVVHESSPCVGCLTVEGVQREGTCWQYVRTDFIQIRTSLLLLYMEILLRRVSSGSAAVEKTIHNSFSQTEALMSIFIATALKIRMETVWLKLAPYLLF